MKLNLNIFKNSVTETQAQQDTRFWSGVFGNMLTGEYSDMILKMVMSPILDELKKVEFTCEPQYDAQLRDITNFLNTKYAVIYKYYFKQGYCAVNLAGGKIEFDNNCTVKTQNAYEFELSNPISTSSFEFEMFRKSQELLLKSIFENINIGLTAQKAITSTLGQFTFFSKPIEGNNEFVKPMTDVERAKYETKFSALMNGTNVGSSVAFTNAALKRDTVLFPIEKLQIVDNVTFCILIAAGVFNVPYDLIPLTGKSTYANQDAAINYLKNSTVAGIAENMLELGRKILKAKNPMIPKKALNFVIPQDVVPENMMDILTPNEKRTMVGLPELKTAIDDNKKMLAEILGVGGTQAMTEIMVNPILDDAKKRELLKILFNLSDAQVFGILPSKII